MISSVFRTAQGLDALGALDYLAQQPFIDADKIAVIGFSAGAININNVIVSGRLESPKNRRFKAAISFYGNCNSITKRSDQDIPVLEIVAEQDGLHGDSCRTAGQFNGVDVFVIDGAQHAFDMVDHRDPHVDPHGTVMQYSSSATKKAGEITEAFLAHHILGISTEKIWIQTRVMGTEEALGALDVWLASNKQLCSKDADYFSKGVDGHIRELKSDRKIIPKFTVTKFKMRKLHNQYCS
jgi:hypothetical protein